MTVVKLKQTILQNVIWLVEKRGCITYLVTDILLLFKRGAAISSEFHYTNIEIYKYNGDYFNCEKIKNILTIRNIKHLHRT